MQQGGNGGFAVGSGNAHQSDFIRRIVVEICGYVRQSFVGIGHFYIVDVFFEIVWSVFVNNCCGTFFNCGFNVIVSVYQCSFLGDKRAVWCGFARVKDNIGDDYVSRTSNCINRYFV